MPRFVQEIFHFPKIFPVICWNLLGIPLFAAGNNASIVRKDIVVLIDRSKSVDDENRKSALELIAGLVEGKVSPETLASWKYQPAVATPDASGSAESGNIGRLSGAAGMGDPIAKDPCRGLIAGLGNYQRAAELRTLVAQGLEPTTAVGLAGRLRDSADLYQAADNSTHVTLAESILAETLFNSDKNRDSYYLIVVSDFNEDCFNRPVSDYDTPTKPAVEVNHKKLTLSEANEQVFLGKSKFDDGNSTSGTYSVHDQKSIRYFREKVEQLLLGDFNYQGAVGQGKRPVMVRIYAHSPKRNLAFTTVDYKWIYPGAAPEISWTASGVSAEAKLQLDIAGNTQEFAAGISAVDGKPFVYSLAEHFSTPLKGGNHQILLQVEDSTDFRPLGAEAGLSFVIPAVNFLGKFEATSTENPATPERQVEILNEKFEGELTPSPGVCMLRATLECDDKRFENKTVKVDENGQFRITIRDFSEEAGTAVSSGKLVTVTVSLPDGKILAKPTPAAVCFLKIQKVEIWADGFPEDRFITLDLRKKLGVSFKSSHAGLKGYKWERPEVTYQGGNAASGVRFKDNVITFERQAPPGDYQILMKLLLDGKKAGEHTFTIRVPAKTNWMPIVLASMAALSLGLFTWHFFQRR